MMAEPTQLVTVRFHYRQVGRVAKCRLHDVAPAEEGRRPGAIWTVEAGLHDVWVHLAVEVPAEGDAYDHIADDIDPHLRRANEAFVKQRPGTQVLFEE